MNESARLHQKDSARRGGRVPGLVVRDLRRTFGESTAVDGVSFEVPRGEVFSILGPNGAGKTTTVRMCSTLLTPTSGHIAVDGVDAVARPRHARRRLGLVLGGDRGFYARASARDNVLFFADVAAVSSKRRTARVDQVLEEVALTDRQHDPVHHFSRGMLGRLHIARALLAEPALLLLDEPTNGLDPDIAWDIRQLIADLATRGTSIVLTTHYLAEAEQLANSILLLRRGRSVVHGPVQAITEHAAAAHTTTCSLPGTQHDPSPDELVTSLRQHQACTRVVSTTVHQRHHLQITWPGEPDLELLAHTAQQLRFAAPADTRTRAATLEDAYLAIIEAPAETGATD